ncbi:aldehyde dehydrogenase [Nocardia vinacea]|uniref:aldehyde dehydrogenase n=1 Tax=Nocardia vinacea TaxID=96468 RepID=UPI0003121DBD|nr:aldehyde dehydrogenase [Nocardia vinacea]
MIIRDELYIDGQWIKLHSTHRLDVVSPSTGETIGRAPAADVVDVDAAVRAARRSFEDGAWRDKSIIERAEILDKACSMLEPKLDEIADLVTSQMGLATSAARMTTPSALTTARYFLDVACRESLSEVRQTSYGPAAVVKEPVGVVASIAPWNGPFYTAMSKLAPALVSGCSVVYKPAAETPLDGFLIAEAFAEAGVPAGVFNYITGDRDTGRALVAHPDVDMVSFTGSTTAGREIARECAERFKRTQLELGGKSAAIVLDDADLDITTAALSTGNFFLTGQICAALSRVLVPRSMHDEVVDALVAAAESYVVGDPFDPATTMGPLASTRQQARVLGYIEAGKAEGARAATGGGVPVGLERGAFVQPTVFAGVDNTMGIAREEIFGPVASVLSYDSIDDAIAIANDTSYGLHGGVFTQDPGRAAYVARRVRAGTFSVNSYIYNAEAPFGGIKFSGIGRDTGPEAVSSYYELKTVNITDEMRPLFA